MFRKLSIAYVAVLVVVAVVLAISLNNTYRAYPADNGTITETLDNSTLQFTLDNRVMIFGDECFTLSWDLQAITSVYVNGDGVAGQGRINYCEQFVPALVEVTSDNGTVEEYIFQPHILTHELTFWLLAIVAGLAIGGVVGVLLAMRYDNLETAWIVFICAQIAAIFVIWCAFFIYRGSVVAFDGQRYFTLFDDAMISMRYAWNFANGNGIVWSVGEPVEGYTNFLMVLYMSVISWLIPQQKFAVLAIQISGILTMLGISTVTALIMHRLANKLSSVWRVVLPVLAFTAVLTYYPLTFWTVMGMETGLWTLFIVLTIWQSIEYHHTQQQHTIYATGIFLGLAQLTRPETPVIIIVIIGYLIIARNRDTTLREAIQKVLPVIGIVVAVVVMHTLFRVLYYGDTVPNTYHLKATGLSFFGRVTAGIDYMTPFTEQTLWLILCGTILALWQMRRETVLFALLFGLFYAEQIYVGGDAWNYWRMTAPFIPLLYVAALYGVATLLENVGAAAGKGHQLTDIEPTLQRTAGSVVALFFIFGTGIWHTNFQFFDQYTFQQPPFNTPARAQQINNALALGDVLSEDATIAVSWGGIPLYYSQIKYGIDILGKSDTVIARLDHVWHTRPGHNKYDFSYSLVDLEPDYIPSCSLGKIDVCEELADTYVEARYEGIRILLRRDSPHVDWSLVEIQQN